MTAETITDFDRPTLAAAVDGNRVTSDGYFEGWQVQSAAIECGIAEVDAGSAGCVRNRRLGG